MKKTVPEILEAAAETFRERNVAYRDGHARAGAILHILHGPGTVAPLSAFESTPELQALFNLYRAVIDKLVRFSDSGLSHIDSIHDACVYSAMVEALITPDQDGTPVDLPRLDDVDSPAEIQSKMAAGAIFDAPAGGAVPLNWRGAPTRS